MELIKPLWAIYNMFDMMKNNKEQFPHVSERLKALEKVVLFISQEEPEQLSDDVKEALENLSKVLVTATELIGKFTGALKVAHMVKCNDYNLELNNLNKSLTDTFVALSGALHVHQAKKLNEQEDKLDKQEKKLEEQQKKLTGQEKIMQEQKKKLAEQEKKLVEQEKRLTGQEKKQVKQEMKLEEQEDKLAEQEDILQRLESKLEYQSRAYYCVLQ